MDKSRKELTQEIIQRLNGDIAHHQNRLQDLKNRKGCLEDGSIFPCYICQGSGVIIKSRTKKERVEDPDAMAYGGYMTMQYRTVEKTVPYSERCPKCDG